MRIRGNATLPGRSAFLWLMLLFLSSAAIAQTTDAVDPLTVESTAGAVKIRQGGGSWESPRAGMRVDLPAVVSTGVDGSIRLGQGGTVITVAVSTAIELYQGSMPGQTLQRVVQNRGSAFYDVAPLEKSRLRVETPYLVAVIKGTEFNVNVAAETSTVALFEGRLRIEAPDIGDVVDLFEGHIARRHKNDSRITVIRMDDGEPLARGGVQGRSDPGLAGDGGPAGAGAGSGSDGPVDGTGAGSDVGIDLGDGLVNTGVDVDADVQDTDVNLSAGGSGELGDTKLGVELSGDVELDGGISAGLDASADLGVAGVDAGLDAGADLGAGEVDLAADVGADLGAAGVDAGLDAGADLGAGEVDLAADVGADLGAAGVDAGLDAGADLGAGEVDLAADVGGDLGGDAIDVDAGASADLGSGNIDADLGAAGADLSFGVDVGGGLDNLLDAEPDLNPLDESGDESEEDAADDPPILDPRNLLGL